MDNSQQKEDLKRRGVLSAMSLFFQSGYSAFLGLVANLILTILLSPAIFGIYITVLSLISFLNYFSDIGLAGALIQKKDLNEDDLATTFTIQQVLTLALIILGFFATAFIRSFYKLPIEGVYLYWALLVSFFISSFKTIPSVFLERKIHFQKIVFVQVVENTLFYATVSVLALLGYGINSFTFAVLLRSVVGLILIYSISFWSPRIGFSVKSLRQLLSFGIPFQASSFLALFKDDLIVLYLGRVLGFEALGYIGWAKKWADAPIRIVMDNINKVIFPLIARFQDDLQKVKNLFQKILYYQTALLAPVYIGMILLMSKFVDIIPNYHKWQQALPFFYIFAVSSLIVSLFAPFINLFNALGKVKVSFSLMAFFTLIMWGLTPLFTRYLGIYGFPLVHLIVSISFSAVLIETKKLMQFDFIKPVYKFLFCAFVMGVVVYLLKAYFVNNSLSFILLLISTGAFSYYLILTTFFRFNLIGEVQSFLEIVKKK